MAAGKLLALSRRTADCARCRATVSTDLEEVDEDAFGGGGEAMEGEAEGEGIGGEVRGVVPKP